MTESKKISSSLDPIETSVHFFDTYRDRLLADCRSEYDATLAMYTTIDQFSTKPKSEQLENCRSYAFFTIDKESRMVRVASNACRLRWCPMCAKAKAITIARSMKNYLSAKPKAKFLTLTLRHSKAPLKHQIDHLYKSFRELRRSKLFKKNCYGGIWFFQVKKSKKDGLWHPHLHCIIDSSFMLQSTLSVHWMRITGGSKIVDIRTIHNQDKIANYVARYSSRPNSLESLDQDETVEMFMTMHGRRLCGKWGSAKAVDLRGVCKIEDKPRIRCCRFEDAMKYQNQNESWRIILKCWLRNKPIPDDYNLDYFARKETSAVYQIGLEFIIDEVFDDD